MAYTPLFHEVYTDLFRAFGKCLNRIHQGEKLTRQDILACLPRIDWSNLQDYHHLLNAIFIFDENDVATPFIPAAFAIAPTKAELDWLADMTRAPEAAFLLTEALRAKLQAMLHGYGTHSDKSILLIRDTSQSPPPKALALIWQALLESRQLNYTNQDGQGHLHRGICAPCRLEYDAAANQYRLIAWLAEENRAIKMNVERLSALSIGAPLTQDYQDKLSEFLASKQRSCLLRLSPRYNAVERAFKIFAEYDKEAIYNEDSDSYQIKLYYYEFDQRELLGRILSLGAAAEVIEPTGLRQEIIAILQKTWQNLPPHDAPAFPSTKQA